MKDDREKLNQVGAYYRVIEVAGRPPKVLDELIGATTVTIENEGHEYILIGTGVKVDRVVLFHEQDAGSTSNTGRIWTMTDQEAGGVAAQPLEPN